MIAPRAHARRHRGVAAAALGAVGALVLTAVVAACGRKALPRPPQWVIPESPAPLEVSAVDGGTKLSWRRPTKYVDGRPLDDLGRFELEWQTLQGLAADGLVELSRQGQRGALQVTSSGRWLIRTIAAVFDPQQQRCASGSRLL